ncbi:MAG: helix-hairpin-helix domain-containing protein [Bacteroidales bacterium]|nr:helix-hairpin-helix domain-containing protein [Bacteroidales bacterium]
MKKLLRDFFSFSSLERKGVLVLVILIFLSTGLNFYLTHRQPKANHQEHTAFLRELEAFERQLTVEKDSSFQRTELYRKENRLKNSKTFRNYPDYQARKTWIDPVVMYVPIPINSADSADFEKLPCIGPVLARRIVRYRNLLGGFYDVRQIKEVYGISDSVYSLIGSRLLADTMGIIKLNVNEASENDLSRHPYIGRFVARGIIRYRSRVQTIRSLDELVKNGLVPAENIEKLEKYLFI